MDTSKLAWGLLSKSVGTYEGLGLNHAGEKFKGSLKMDSALPEKLLVVKSLATGDTGEVYHEEVSWIGRDIAGDLTLYVTSTNHPGVTPHIFDRIEEKGDSKSVIFRYGHPLDGETFREEVTFSVFADGAVAHHYSWGLPGGDFEPRSGARMMKVGRPEVTQ